MSEKKTFTDSVLSLFGVGHTSTFNPITKAGAPDDAATSNVLVPSIPLTQHQLEAACRTGIYQQLCGRLPGVALSEAPTVALRDKEMTEGLQDRLTELDAWTKLQQAARLCERWGVAGLLVRTSSARDLAQPLSFPGDGKILELMPISRAEMRPEGWDNDLNSPSFGEPEMLTLRLRMGHGQSQPRLVHTSRVVLLRGPRPDGDTIDPTMIGDGWDDYGLPLLDKLRGALPLLLTLERETSRLVQVQGVLVKTLSAESMEKLLSGTGAASIQAGLEFTRRTLSAAGMQVQLPGETLERLSSGAEHYTQIEQAIYHIAAMTLGWPIELVNGQPPPGLGDTGKGAQAAYRPLVESYQDDRLAVPAREVCRVLLAEQGNAGEVVDVQFGDPLSPTPAERASVRQAHTTADALAVQAGIMPAEYFAKRYESTGGWREDLPPYVPEEQPIEGMPGPAAEGEVAPVATATEPKEPIPVGYASTLQALIEAHALHPERAAQYRGMLAAMGIGPEVAAVILPDMAPGSAPVEAEPADPAQDQAPSPLSALVALVPNAESANAVKVLRAQVRGIIPGLLEEEDPHVTLLYLGAVAGRNRARLRMQASEALQGTVLPSSSAVQTLRSFHEGDDGVPLVLAMKGDSLHRLHRVLLARLAPLVTKEQYPIYVPHLTLGYAPEALTPGQIAALERLTLPAEIEYSSVTVKSGDRELLSVAV